MKHLYLGLLFLFTINFLSAQTTISGSVVDSTKAPLSGASVILLQQADSVLAKFDITENDGRFTLQDVPQGQYWLRVTFVGYENYTESLVLDGQAKVDMGQIILSEQAATLEEVIVEAEHAPIVINGDTISYNTNAFRTRPNAPVEDLLKRLPGVEVDRNGDIKAQGKDVDRVLVDGKEFFGDDPKIATQNLPADIVDKVQVYDRKSESAAFTGVDDGERSTTINLSLKEDKKQGYFGTLEAGYGTDSRFSTKGNINRFSSDYQLSGLGRFNNINQQGFTLRDYIELMGGMQNLMSGSNTVSPRDLGISFDGDARSDGLATTAAGGLNLNYDLNKKTELSLNYFYNGIDRNMDRELERQNFQGGNATFTTLEEEGRQVINKNHRLNSLLKYEIDSMQDLQLRANFGFNEMGLESMSFRKAFNTEQNLESTLERDYQYGNQQFSFDSRAVYRRRLDKPGRSLVADLSYGMREGTGESDLTSLNEFPNEGLVESLQQEQNTDEGRHNYSGRLSYTEPLGKGHFLELSYRRQNYRESFARDFFDLISGQPLLNSSLSNRFISDYTYDRVGLALQRNRNSSNLTLSLDAQEARLKGSLQSEQEPLRRSFTNLLPGLNWRYEFTSTKSLELRYRTNVQEPTVEQLQPIVDNSDPLNIYRGNPALRPEYRHELRLQSLFYDAFSFTSFFMALDAIYTQNRITNATTIDEQLRQSITPVNVDNDYLLFGNVSFGTPLRFMKSRINLGAEGRYNRGFLVLNEVENQVNRFNGSFNLSLENRKKEVVDIRAGAEWGYQQTAYIENEALNQQFATESYFIDGSLDIGKNWQIHTLFDYQVFPQGPFAERQAFPLWEASVSRFFGEQQQLQLRLSTFDLLDRNTGINREATFNYIENERMVALGRYFMLSAVYSLKGFGK